MKKILISGASGFIGGYLWRYFVNLGYKVIGYDRSEKSEDWKYIQEKFDIIIHCAAQSKILESGTDIWDSNPGLTHKLLNIASRNKPLFINLSSIAVYGPKAYPPHELESCNPWSPYGMSKLAGEFLVNKYTDDGLVNGINLRLGGVCGPHMTHGILKRIIQKIYDKGTEIEFFGPEPGNYMSYVHISDLADIINELIEQNLPIKALNVCGQKALSIKDIVDLLSNGKLNIKWEDNPNFKNDPSIFEGEISRLGRHLYTQNALIQLKKDYFLE